MQCALSSNATVLVWQIEIWQDDTGGWEIIVQACKNTNEECNKLCCAQSATVAHGRANIRSGW